MSIVLNDTTARASFTATAAQTVFALSFKFFATTDLFVAKNGVALTLTTDYTVQGAGLDTGMGITLTSGAALNDVITVIRILAIERTTDFQLTGPFPIASLNTALSKLTAMIQQVRDSVGRSPILGVYDVDGTGAYLANGNRITNVGTPSLGTDAVNKTYADAIAAVAGNVTPPGASFANKVLIALSATTWGWGSIVSTAISDSTAFGRSFLVAANGTAGRTLLGLASISTFAVASAAEFFAGTSSRALDAALIKTVTSPVTVTPASGAATIDFSAGTQFVVAALTQNTTFTLSNAASNLGKSGTIEIIQNATGGWTSTFTGAKTDTGLALSLSTAISAKNVVAYYINAAGEVVLGMFARATA